MARAYTVSMAFVMIVVSSRLPSHSAAPSGPPTNGKAPSGLQSASNPLDSNAIRSMYLDGDFEKAIVQLENGIAQKRLINHDDSVFAFKHLGVMYAAREDTREKGKYYMMQLLYIEPTAKIMDMYTSDMIYMIFRNIQEEFELSLRKLQRARDQVNDGKPAGGGRSPEPERTPEPANHAKNPEGPVRPDAGKTALAPGESAAPAPLAPSQTGPDSDRSRNRRYLIGAAGAAALVGVGVAAYLLMSDAEPSREVYDVD